MHISEDDAGINNGASVVNGAFSTSFSFGQSNSNTAQYTFTFDVKQNCNLPANQAAITAASNTAASSFIKDMVSPGAVSFFSTDILSVLKPKWEAEYIPPVPVYVPPPIYIPPVPVAVPEPVIPDTIIDPDILATTITVPEAPDVRIEDQPVPVIPDEPIVPEIEDIEQEESISIQPTVEPVPVPELDQVEAEVTISIGAVEDEEIVAEEGKVEVSTSEINPLVAPIIIQQVELKTGDIISLESDIDKDQFFSFSTFRSTQFFVNEFERSEKLLKNEKDVLKEDSEDEFPIWIIIVICSVVFVFVLIVVSICFMMSKNKQNRNLQERAIIRELALAKSEGIEIPDDLEKRLERF